MKDSDESRGSGDTSSSSSSSSRLGEDKKKHQQVWGVFVFVLIGATATTYAVAQLRRTANWFSTQMPRSQCSWKGSKGSSFRSRFQEESWRRYNRRMQEEYEEEMERVERIRRMQSAFNRERNKYKRGYERWRENDPGTYYQQFEQEDWYWKTNPSFEYQRTHFRDTPRESAVRPLSHHYTVLGLDRLRTKPYSDDEIKTAFRAKAKLFHPDQNQDNKELAEAKFKEIMASYDAIKAERKNKNL